MEHQHHHQPQHHHHQQEQEQWQWLFTLLFDLTMDAPPSADTIMRMVAAGEMLWILCGLDTKCKVVKDILLLSHEGNASM